MNIIKFSPLFVFVFVITAACATKLPSAYPKIVNIDELTGFVPMGSDNDTGIMDYELDGADGNPILFNSCDDVKKTPETNIVTHQYHLWRLIQINCKVVKMSNSAVASTHSYWPSSFDRAFIADLPATAIPDLGGGGLNKRKGLLKDVEPVLDVININFNSIEVTLSGNLDITYVLIARGDFDRDGTENILLRLDWNITTAFGKGFSLLLLSKPSISSEAEIVWRDG